MKVSIKSLSVDMDVKSNGVEFEIRSPDGTTFLGDCFLTMTSLIWCNGKTEKKNGQKVKWEDFIVLMNDPDVLKGAIKQAKKNA